MPRPPAKKARPRPSPKVAKPLRRRRDAATVRSAILDAAEKRLVVAGPAGIRLQDVAADVGISHPNVLHHFGSREALVAAVISRSGEAMHRALIEAIMSSAGPTGVTGTELLQSMFDRIARVLDDGGHSRVYYWLALAGHHVEHSSVTLRDVAEAGHQLRLARSAGGTPPLREDTEHVVLLVTLALSALSVLSPAVPRSIGLSGDAPGNARFRRWLADLLVAHLGLG